MGTEREVWCRGTEGTCHVPQRLTSIFDGLKHLFEGYFFQVLREAYSDAVLLAESIDQPRWLIMYTCWRPGAVVQLVFVFSRAGVCTHWAAFTFGKISIWGLTFWDFSNQDKMKTHFKMGLKIFRSYFRWGQLAIPTTVRPLFPTFSKKFWECALFILQWMSKIILLCLLSSSFFLCTSPKNALYWHALWFMRCI